jgi:hypothetical protein
MKKATVIPLEFWQDPQRDVILIFSEYECSVYCACWKAAGDPADFIGHLSFGHAASVRGFRREFLPYQVQGRHHSYILQIVDSELVQEHKAYRQRHYPVSLSRLSDPNHYIVVGHDIYHEILADNFTSTAIAKQEIRDPRLIRLFTSA